MRIKALLGRTVVTAAIIAGTISAGMAAASASPSNAPTSLSGTFTCPGGVTGTFVVNSGNNHAPVTWNAANLTFASGGTGIFVPTGQDLSFNGSPPQHFTKGNAPGSVTCDITAPLEPPFFLTGTVTGNIVHTG
jgi:hypothetical protein